MSVRIQLTILFFICLLGPTAPAMAQEPVPTLTATVSEPGTVVSTASINIRACPSLDCEVRATARLGDTLTVTGVPRDGFIPVTIGNTSGYAYALFIATQSRGTPELRHGLPGCQRVAFIFNIGVGYEPDMGVLKWMKANGIPATLFPMGWWARENPEVLKEMADMGFLIGSHGDERAELTNRSDAEVVADIEHALVEIERATGRKPASYFTAYAAAMDARVRGIVARAGYIPVSWDVSAADWDFGITPDDVFQKVMPNVVDGSIVEFHLDAPTSAQSTGVAIPWIVERLENKGYDFVTISEMALPCP